MERLKLTIKPKLEVTEKQCLRSAGYSIKINDWELGRGVTDFRLEMPASERPKVTITFTPDVMNIDAIQELDLNLKNLGVGDEFRLDTERLMKVAKQKQERKFIFNLEETKERNKVLEKQLLISKVVLTSIFVTSFVNFIYQLLN